MERIAMLEIIANTLNDAQICARAGADRVELVRDLSRGGLSPEVNIVKEIIDNKLPQPYIMLRAHDRDYTYTQEELHSMHELAKKYEAVGAEHIVFGALTPDLEIDLDAVDQVLKDTQLTLTFHRAIDDSHNLIKSIELINTHPRITHVLTSGGAGKTIDHLPILQKMIDISTYQKIVVGSGLSYENIPLILNQLRGDFDLHVGTSVRAGLSDGPVIEQEVKKIVTLIK